MADIPSRKVMTGGARAILRKISEEADSSSFLMGEALGTAAETPEAIATKMIEAEKCMDTAKRWISRFLFINNLEYMKTPPGTSNSACLSAAQEVVNRMKNSAPSSAQESAKTFMQKMYPQHQPDCNYVMFANECNCGLLRDSIDGIESGEDAIEGFKRRHPELSFSVTDGTSTPRPESNLDEMVKPGWTPNRTPILDSGDTPVSEDW